MQEKCVLIYDDDEEISKICQLILAEEYQQVHTFLSCENVFADIEPVEA